MKILLLEDDPVLAGELKLFLNNKNFYCETVSSGNLFLEKTKNKIYSIYLLDINVPNVNGLEVCKNIRQFDKVTPIIMLTAYGEIEEKTEAFTYGADDYMVKPFNFDELVLRINAVLRKKNNANDGEDVIQINDIEVRKGAKEVYRAGVKIDLTPKEYKLLLQLIEANGKVVSKQEIAAHLWDYHIETTLNTIEVYINFLRNKLDKNFDHKLIQTKIGFGYFIKK